MSIKEVVVHVGVNIYAVIHAFRAVLGGPARTHDKVVSARYFFPKSFRHFLAIKYIWGTHIAKMPRRAGILYTQPCGVAVGIQSDW